MDVVLPPEWRKVCFLNFMKILLSSKFLQLLQCRGSHFAAFLNQLILLHCQKSHIRDCWRAAGQPVMCPFGTGLCWRCLLRYLCTCEVAAASYRSKGVVHLSGGTLFLKTPPLRMLCQPVEQSLAEWSGSCLSIFMCACWGLSITLVCLEWAALTLRFWVIPQHQSVRCRTISPALNMRR